MTQDQKHNLLFLLIPCAFVLPFILSPTATATSVKVAAAGGLVSLLGVAAMARALLRVGVFHWISQLTVSDFSEFKDPRIDDKDEVQADIFYQSVIGPWLVGVGTVINGFSGYF